MKKEIAKKFVNALRSGNYKQGFDQLFDGENYCVLGVLCKIAEKEEICDKTKQGFDRSTISLPDSVKLWAGMYSDIGEFRDGLEKSLLVLNDIQRLNFDQLATLIEKNYKQL